MTISRSKRLAPPTEDHPETLNAGSPPAPRLTPGERKAWRSGFVAGIEHCTGQLELFRIRFTARGIDIDAPWHWPSVTPSPVEAWAETKAIAPRRQRRTA